MTAERVRPVELKAAARQRRTALGWAEHGRQAHVIQFLRSRAAVGLAAELSTAGAGLSLRGEVATLPCTVHSGMKGVGAETCLGRSRCYDRTGNFCECRRQGLGGK
jgi:hypothetical protein